MLLFLLLLTGSCRITYAASDDPGAGRLSGNYIPEEFYDTGTNSDFQTFPALRRYGSFSTSNPYTNKTYSHSDVFSARTIVHGVDVSEWQGTIDWEKVKAAGIDFAIIRVGYRGYGAAGTLSEKTKDKYFDENMKGALAAGLQVGIYIFSQAITTEEAKAEAEYILNYIGDYNVTLPLVMDYEYASDSSTGGRVKTAKLSKDAATKICLAFCETISAAGYTPMVYANKSMLESQLNASTLSAGCRIWLANYTTSTTYGGTYDFWQYASDGTVNGISTKVDMNYYYAQPTDNFLPVLPAEPISDVPGSNEPGANIDLSTAVIAPIANQIYTGLDITPAVTVTYNNQTLTLDTDYTISYRNNNSIGTATIEITGKNNYQGTKSITFDIVPKPTSGLKASKRTTSYITLSWTKDSAVSGYEIYRANAVNGTYQKLKTVSSSTTTTYKNTKLTAGQCYYYKIRSYKSVSGKTYYGDFSSVNALYTTTGYTRLAIAKSGTVIYAATSTAGSVVASPAANSSMTVTYATTDEAGKTWYHVTYKSGSVSHTGFVLSGKVTIGKQGKVSGSKVNVRKSYSTSSKKLTTLSKNKKVTILQTKKKKGLTWYKITFKKSGKKYTGWMYSYYIKIV